MKYIILVSVFLIGCNQNQLEDLKVAQQDLIELQLEVSYQQGFSCAMAVEAKIVGRETELGKYCKHGELDEK